MGSSTLPGPVTEAASALRSRTAFRASSGVSLSLFANLTSVGPGGGPGCESAVRDAVEEETCTHALVSCPTPSS